MRKNVLSKKLLILFMVIFIRATDCNSEWHDPDQQFELKPEQIQEYSIKAEKGDKEAATKLYNYYKHFEYDSEKRFYWLKKAAENGDITAQYNMGSEYLHNPKIRDKKQALFWFNKAAEQGDFSAKSEIEKFLSECDIKELTKQANKGNPDAAYKLYEFYYHIELDNSQAEIWLKKAAENGHQGAKILIKGLSNQ